MDYKVTIEEIGALAMFFTGWSKADLMNLSVRERRHWVSWALAITAKRRREAEQAAQLAQQVQYTGR